MSLARPDAKEPSANDDPRGLESNRAGHVEEGDLSSVSVDQSADPGGLGGLFRIRDQQCADQPTLPILATDQAAERPK